MAGNNSLSAAKRAKQDEFYTQLPDIERELRHYSRHFKGEPLTTYRFSSMIRSDIP